MLLKMIFFFSKFIEIYKLYFVDKISFNTSIILKNICNCYYRQCHILINKIFYYSATRVTIRIRRNLLTCHSRLYEKNFENHIVMKFKPQHIRFHDCFILLFPDNSTQGQLYCIIKCRLSMCFFRFYILYVI